MKGYLEELLLGGRPMTELEIKQNKEIERLNNIINELQELKRSYYNDRFWKQQI